MSLDAREFCAECFIPIDGKRPGCQACKQRDLYRRLKESNPRALWLLNQLKHAQEAVRHGWSTANPARVEQLRQEYREARAA